MPAGKVNFKFYDATAWLINKDHAENEAERLVPDLFLFFKKALYEVKASNMELSFNVI